MSNIDPNDLLQRANKIQSDIKNDSQSTENAKRKSDIRELYKKIILVDISFAEKNQISTKLWRLIYGSIKPLREKYKKLISESKNNKKKEVEAQNVEGSYKSELEQAALFYENLIAKLKQEYRKDTKNAEFVNKTRFNCLMNVGDIYRYFFEINNSNTSRQKWPLAERNYKKAGKLFSMNGNPHNQLAVLHSLKKDRFNTMYYYIRAFACTEPFLLCVGNLKSCFGKAYTLDTDPKNTKIKESIFEMKNRNEKDILMEKEVFFTEYTLIQNYLSPFNEKEISSETVLNEFISHFATFNKKGYLSSSVLMRMSAINIFAYCAVNGRLPTDSLKEYQFTKVNYPNQQLEFCLHFFGSMTKSFLDGPPRFLHLCFGAIHITLEWMRHTWKEIEDKANKFKSVEKELNFSLQSLCSFLSNCFSFEDETILYPVEVESDKNKKTLENENLEFVGFHSFSSLYDQESLSEEMANVTPKDLYQQRKKHILSFIDEVANNRIKRQNNTFTVIDTPPKDTNKVVVVKTTNNTNENVKETNNSTNNTNKKPIETKSTNHNNNKKSNDNKKYNDNKNSGDNKNDRRTNNVKSRNGWSDNNEKNERPKHRDNFNNHNVPNNVMLDISDDSDGSEEDSSEEIIFLNKNTKSTISIGSTQTSSSSSSEISKNNNKTVAPVILSENLSSTDILSSNIFKPLPNEITKTGTSTPPSLSSQSSPSTNNNVNANNISPFNLHTFNLHNKTNSTNNNNNVTTLNNNTTSNTSHLTSLLATNTTNIPAFNLNFSPNTNSKNANNNNQPSFLNDTNNANNNNNSFTNTNFQNNLNFSFQTSPTTTNKNTTNNELNLTNNNNNVTSNTSPNKQPNLYNLQFSLFPTFTSPNNNNTTSPQQQPNSFQPLQSLYNNPSYLNFNPNSQNSPLFSQNSQTSPFQERFMNMPFSTSPSPNQKSKLESWNPNVQLQQEDDRPPGF